LRRSSRHPIPDEVADPGECLDKLAQLGAGILASAEGLLYSRNQFPGAVPRSADLHRKSRVGPGFQLGVAERAERFPQVDKLGQQPRAAVAGNLLFSGTLLHEAIEQRGRSAQPVGRRRRGLTVRGIEWAS
jgi:hypothetical protein